MPGYVESKLIVDFFIIVFLTFFAAPLLGIAVNPWRHPAATPRIDGKAEPYEG